VQHNLIVLEGFRAYSQSYGCLEPSVKVFVQRYLGPFQIAAQVTLSQFSCKICLGFPHTAVNRSVVIVALFGFVISAQIDPDEPSSVASSNDLANFASHRVSSLARKRGTQLAHSCGIKAQIFRLIKQRVADRP
jgi:hypothetical protein